MADLVYRPVIRTALGLFRLLGFQFDIRGVEHIPSAGGAVLASNHVSYLDFMFVGLPAHLRGRRLVRFLAKKSVFDHWAAGPLMRGMRHIAVDRAAGADAYRLAVEALREGELVGVFPEQTISRSFVPRAMKAGAARMALEAAVPLLPVVTWGGHRFWTSGRRPHLRRRVPVSVWVGEPLTPVPGESAHEMTERLAVAVRALVDDVLAAYAAPEEPSVWWMPAHLGGTAPTPADAADSERTRIAAVRETSRPAGR